VTQSVASIARTSTRIGVEIGVALVGLHNIIPSTGYGRGHRQSTQLASIENAPVFNGPPPNTTSERQFPRRSGIGHDANTRGRAAISNATTIVASTRGRSNIRVIHDRIAICT